MISYYELFVTDKLWIANKILTNKLQTNALITYLKYIIDNDVMIITLITDDGDDDWQLTVPFCARNDIDWSMPPPSVPMYLSQRWHISASSNYNSTHQNLTVIHTINVVFHSSNFSHKLHADESKTFDAKRFPPRESERTPASHGKVHSGPLNHLSTRASPPFGMYQIILISDKRHRCTWNLPTVVTCYMTELRMAQRYTHSLLKCRH